MGKVVSKKISLDNGMILGDQIYYDKLGRIVEVIHPNGTSKNFAYIDSKNQIVITDEDGKSKTYQYESFGSPNEKRLQSITCSGDAGGIVYNYDSFGNLFEVFENGGEKQIRKYQYNFYNQLEEIHSIEADVVRYEYFDDGTIKNECNSKGCLNFRYDDLKRVTLVTHSEKGIQTIFNYNDYLGTATSTELKTGVVTTLQKDSAGRIYSKKQKIDNKVFGIHYGYDSLGDLTSISYPNQSKVVNYEYDSKTGLLNSMPGYIDNVYYHAGKPKEVHYSNRTVIEVGYNANLEVESILDSKNRVDLTYELTPTGAIKSVTDASDSKLNQNFEYEDMFSESITKEEYPNFSKTNNYMYDTIYNRDSKENSGINQKYIRENNRLEYIQNGSENFPSLDWDNDGSIKKIQYSNEEYQDFVFDERNRLTQISSSNFKVNYTYDSSNWKVKKKIDKDEKTTYYIRGLRGEVLYQYLGEDRNQINSSTKQYVFSPLGNLFERVGYHSKEDFVFTHTDSMGTTMFTENMDGELLEKIYLTRFGESLTGTPVESDDYAFVGKEFEEETGLYYFLARFYHPKFGQFLSLDPLLGKESDPVTFNRYTFVNNAPTKYLDPFGFSSTDCQVNFTFDPAGKAISKGLFPSLAMGYAGEPLMTMEQAKLLRGPAFGIVGLIGSLIMNDRLDPMILARDTVIRNIENHARALNLSQEARDIFLSLDDNMVLYERRILISTRFLVAFNLMQVIGAGITAYDLTRFVLEKTGGDEKVQDWMIEKAAWLGWDTTNW